MKKTKVNEHVTTVHHKGDGYPCGSVKLMDIPVIIYIPL